MNNDINGIEIEIGNLSGEPLSYLKSASVSGNTLTLTNKDSTTVVYTPEVPDTYRTAAAQDIIDATKQDILTAGNNVQINNNVISATDTTYSDATTSASGLMSSSDKIKLNSIPEDATAVSVSATGTSTNKVKYITIDDVESKMATDVINNVTSTSTEDALSANMGKELQDQISNLKNIGRFLAIWNCATGLPLTEPTVLPYTYKTGDYYRVGTIADGYHHAITASGSTTSLGTYSGTYSFTFALTSESVSSQLTTIESVTAAMDNTTRYNATGTLTTSDTTYTITSIIKWVQDDVSYIALCDADEEKLALVLTSTTQTDTVTGGLTNYKPNGATYTGAASSTIETETVEVSYVYYYDGTNWLAQSAGGGGLVQDVQINGTTILDSGSGVANIPNSSASASGVMTSTQYTKLEGIEAGAEVNTVDSVDGATGAVVLSDVKYTTQTLTTAQQAQARANIGAGTLYTVTVDI